MIKHIKGKKKGSTILMVLMISTILIIVSAVMMNSLIITTYANDLEKNESDYLYAAEGGIEYGVQKYKSTGSTGFPYTINYLKTIDNNPEKGIKEVKVSLEEYPVGSGKKCIISTVYGKDKDSDGSDDELYKIILPVGESPTSLSNVLKYSICSATNIKIDVTGESDFDSSQISYHPDHASGNNFNYGTIAEANKPDNDGGGGGTDPKELASEAPRIKTNRIKPSDDIIKKGGLQQVIDMARPMAVENIDSALQIPNSVGKVNVSQIFASKGVVYSGYDYEIILVNGDLEIDCSIASNINYAIIIVSGNLKIKGPNDSSISSVPQTLKYSTLYANSIEISGTAALHTAFSPKYPAGFDTIGSNIVYVDEFLSKYMDNWGASGGTVPGGTGGEVDFGNVEYINP